MTLKFTGKDFGPFVLGREVLKKFPKASLEFCVAGDNSLSEEKLWDGAVMQILNQWTRFGRIGFFYDRKNKNAEEFCHVLSQSKFTYTPTDTRRAEKTPILSFFETQILHEMANEGLADSVEFRRLVRKFIRKAKHAHCDTIFFMEAIFGEEEVKKILQHIAGTQIRVFAPSDFLSLEGIKEGKERKIQITTGDDPQFTHHRAEKILKTKLKK